jgi:ABC-2 type transport system permease protein
MKKIGIIAKREFLSRVTKKAFILATLIAPLAIGVFGFIAGRIMTYRDDKIVKIAIVDASERNVSQYLKPSQRLTLVNFPKTLEQTKEAIKGDKTFAGILMLPPIEDLEKKQLKINFYTDDRLNPELSSTLKELTNEALRQYKISAFNLDTQKIAALRTAVSVEPEPLSANAPKRATSKTVAITSVLSALLGFIMYLSIFIYGSMIMRSVMEEKTSRIAEVMISSVKPFELMMGKIIGVGAVGLLQLMIWFVLIFAISTGLQVFFGGSDPAAASQMAMNPALNGSIKGMQEAQTMNDPSAFLAELGRVNWWFIVPTFIFYFLAGYLLYASLFAAVGSAVGDDMGEAQSLTLPITMPVLFAIYIAMSAIQNPDSKLAVFASYFPLFSPIVMPARLATDPPIWQVLISMAILLAAVVFFVWLAGRIYRVGILMYGKKASFKELGKWVFYRD